MSPIKWLIEPKRRTSVVVGGGITVGILGVGLFLLIAQLFFGTPTPTQKAPAGPIANKQPTPQPTAPTIAAKPPTTEQNPTPAPSELAAVVPPEKAVKMVGEKVVVEFKVHSTGETSNGSKVFLNSGSIRDENNFTVVLEMRKINDALKKAGIGDPKSFYEHKTIRVSGTVTEYKARQSVSRQIIVEDMNQIELPAK